jgi:hypothetical protein
MADLRLTGLLWRDGDSVYGSFSLESVKTGRALRERDLRAPSLAELIRLLVEAAEETARDLKTSEWKAGAAPGGG